MISCARGESRFTAPAARKPTFQSRSSTWMGHFSDLHCLTCSSLNTQKLSCFHLQGCFTSRACLGSQSQARGEASFSSLQKATWWTLASDRPNLQLNGSNASRAKRSKKAIIVRRVSIKVRSEAGLFLNYFYQNLHINKSFKFKLVKCSRTQ